MEDLFDTHSHFRPLGQKRPRAYKMRGYGLVYGRGCGVVYLSPKPESGGRKPKFRRYSRHTARARQQVKDYKTTQAMMA